MMALAGLQHDAYLRADFRGDPCLSVIVLFAISSRSHYGVANRLVPSMKRTVVFMAWILGGVLLNAPAGHAQVWTPLAQSPGICAAPLSSTQARVVDSTAFMVPNNLVVNNGDGTYDVINSPLWEYPGDAPICGSSDFYGMTSAKAGRTAVLIGRTTFVTAAHTTGFDPSAYTLIFAPMYDAQACSEFAWTNIPADNVYPGTSAGANNIILPDGSNDYITFNVNRYVVDRKPIKIRRSGAPRLSDRFSLVSNPMWGGLRVESGGLFLGTIDAAGSWNYGDYIVTDLHPLDGSSGGAIYNLDQEVMEVGIARPLDGIFDLDGDCLNIYDRDSEFLTTNTSLIKVKDSIPRTEILVEPVVDVLHVGDIGGPLTNPTSTYTMSAALGGNQYEIINENPTYFGAPGLTTDPPAGLHALSLVHPTPLTINVNSANVYQCSLWDYVVNVRDVYNEQNNYLRHRFEIGAKEIEVTGAGPWDIEVFGNSVPASKTFTVRNLRPTTTEVRASYVSGGNTRRQLVLFDGGGYSTFSLAPNGEPGDTRDVVFSINPAAVFPSPGNTLTVQTQIVITDYICSLNDPFLIPVSLRTGSQTGLGLSTGDPMEPPQNGQPLGAPTTIDVPMVGTAGWCVGDVEAEIGMLDVNGGPNLPSSAANLDVRIIAPNNAVAHVWSQNIVPAGQESSYVGQEEITYFGYPIDTYVFHLDDATAPPLGPDLLSVFSGVAVTGKWQLELRTGQSTNFLPSHARLKFVGTQCP